MKRGGWQKGVKGFLRNNLTAIVLIIFIFLAGVVFGSLAIRTLDSTKRSEMVDFLSSFFVGLSNQLSDEYHTNLSDVIWLNLKIIFFIWILGISIIGIIGIPILIFLRGFVIGFTVGFLVNELGLKGMVFALASILPQNLIIIPVTIFAGVIAVSFGITLFKSLILKRPISFGQHLITYTLFMIAAGGGLLIASVIEAFITPVFMEFAARFLIGK